MDAEGNMLHRSGNAARGQQNSVGGRARGHHPPVGQAGKGSETAD